MTVGGHIRSVNGSMRGPTGQWVLWVLVEIATKDPRDSAHLLQRFLNTTKKFGVQLVPIRVGNAIGIHIEHMEKFPSGPWDGNTQKAVGLVLFALGDEICSSHQGSQPSTAR